MIKNKFLLAFVILSSNSLFLESSNLVIKNAEIYDGIENNSSLIIDNIKFGDEVLRRTFYPSLDFYKYQRTFQGFRNISMNSNGSIPTN